MPLPARTRRVSILVDGGGCAFSLEHESRLPSIGIGTGSASTTRHNTSGHDDRRCDFRDTQATVPQCTVFARMNSQGGQLTLKQDVTNEPSGAIHFAVSEHDPRPLFGPYTQVACYTTTCTWVVHAKPSPHPSHEHGMRQWSRIRNHRGGATACTA